MDHDRRFKDLLTTFFAEFLELFFPKVAAALDRESIHFLDKEIFPDLIAGDRHEVDLLAQVRLSGQETFILIHVENQSTWQADFPKRMFKYFALLHQKFDLPIFLIALFSFDRPLGPVTDLYELKLFDQAVLRFQFQVIQLNRLKWREFVTQPNPVASALMSKMQIAAEDRPRVKLECLRMLLTLKLDPARTKLIGEFMKSYLALTAQEEIVYTGYVGVVDPREKETIMEYMNEWEEKGQIKGRVELLVRQCRRRFGDIPTGFAEELRQLTMDQLDNLGEAMLDFKALGEAQDWIARAHLAPAGN